MRFPSSSFLRAFCISASVLLVSPASPAQKAPAPETPKIRTMPAFLTLEGASYKAQIADTLKMLKYARTVYESRGYEVQTIRISTQPFPEYTGNMKQEEAVAFFRELDALAEKENFIVSIGPAMVKDDDDPGQAVRLGEILNKAKFLNGSVVVAGEDGVHWNAIGAGARLLKFLEDNTEHSQGNFRFCATALVPQATPFYPGSYHTGFGHKFAIGLQSANVVAAAFHNAPDLATAKRTLAGTPSLQCADIERLANPIHHDIGGPYMGVHVSPEPRRHVPL